MKLCTTHRILHLHMVKYIYFPTLLLLSTTSFSSNLVLPLYSADCTRLESYLADMHAVQQRPTHSEGYTSFYGAAEDSSPSIIDFDCYDDRLYRATIGYRYTGSREVKSVYIQMRNLLIKALDKPDKKDPDKFSQIIGHLNQEQEIKSGDMNKHDYFDFRKHHEQWSKKDYKIKIHIMKNSKYGWFLSYRVLPNFK